MLRKASCWYAPGSREPTTLRIAIDNQMTAGGADGNRGHSSRAVRDNRYHRLRLLMLWNRPDQEQRGSMNLTLASPSSLTNGS